MNTNDAHNGLPERFADMSARADRSDAPPDDAAGRCETLAAGILDFCGHNDLKIVAAESLTGGLLADAFVRIPGASGALLGSAVTYAVESKASILGVDRGLLEREGAVHPEVARQMAVGVARLYAQPEYADRIIALATTGVAGPGPDGGKPAGLVYIGISLPPAYHDAGVTQTHVYELHLQGSRARIRERTVLRVLQNVSQFTGNSMEY